MRPIPDMWRYAKLAGEYPSNASQLPQGGELIRIKRDNDFAFVAVEDKRVVFAFAGSDDRKDWFDNFRATPTTDDYVHKGFWLCYLDLQGRIHELSQKYGPHRQIFATGHSKGGALAALCARGISHNNGIPCSCITFAAPRQGGKAYREEYDSLPINHTNVVNGWDIVPTLPPRLLGYRHVGKRYWLKQPWWHRFFRKIHDHYPAQYDRAIERRFGDAR